MPREADLPVMRVAIAVVLHQGRCLIGRRGSDATLAGYWEFPGGKIIADESPADAAVRECREETGLAVTVSEDFPVVRHRYSDGELCLHFFRCTLVDAAPEPTPPFRWVALGALSDYEFPPANARVLARLRGEGSAGR